MLHPAPSEETTMGRHRGDASETKLALEEVERGILLLRQHRVMLDEHLAALYGVEVRALNQAVKRNRDRFPDDFMFQLTAEEVALSRSQAVIQEPRARGAHRKYRPYAFTEQGVAMLSSVLRSERAIRVNIEIMRTFVRLRRMLQLNEDLARKLAALEARYDEQFKVVFDAIRELMTPPATPRRRIGFEHERPR
jgi:hypothetical protein